MDRVNGRLIGVFDGEMVELRVGGGRGGAREHQLNK